MSRSITQTTMLLEIPRFERQGWREEGLWEEEEAPGS